MRRAYWIVIPLVAGAIGLGILAEMDAGRYARLCQLALGFVALASIAATLRGKLRDGLVVVCSLVFGFTLIEGGQLAFGKPLPFTTDQGMSKSRPVMGWGPIKPGVFSESKTDGRGHVVYNVHVTIDDDLNRKVISAKGPGAVAFFGDSFVFGEGLNDPDTLPQAFADLLDRKIPVLNLGFSGWSPAQNLAALEAGLYDHLLQSPRRFVLMTAAWHVERTNCTADFSTRAPRYLLVDGQIKRDGFCRTPFQIAVHNVLGTFSVYRRLAKIQNVPTHHDVETYLKIVEGFVKTAKSRYGVGTTIMFIPYDDAYLKPTGYTEDDLVAAYRAMGADVLDDGLPANPGPGDLIIPGDGHPSGLANRLRAKALLDLIRKDEPKVLDSREARVGAH